MNPLKFCVCAHEHFGAVGVRFKASIRFSKESMCLKGLRDTGLVDSPHSAEEEANSDWDSGLPKIPQQIRGRAGFQTQISLTKKHCAEILEGTHSVGRCHLILRWGN